MSYLYPVLAKEVIPGDRFDVSFAYKMELAALFNPVYDGLNVNFEAFYVPNRIVDPRWKTFWTGYNEYNPIEPMDINPLTINASFGINNTGGDPNYSYLDAPSSVAAKTIGIGSLSDFLDVQFSSYYENGFPYFGNTGTGTFYLRNLSAYKYLAYHKIVDEFYINTRLEQSVLGPFFESSFYLTGTTRVIDLPYYLNASTANIELVVQSNQINVNLFQLRQRNYSKDAFTTALPWPELGGESVRIPVNTDFSSAIGSGSTPSYGPLSAAALGTIAQLKMAFKEYSYAMKDLYKGPRYIENIFAHFGETIREGLVQRPVYLGSVRDYVNFGQVFQTAPSNSTDSEGNELGVGDYSGRGSVEGMHKIFESEFQEPGYIFVLFSISPNARYFQGIDRSNIKRSRKDWFSPEYQDIGEDFIVKHELFSQPSSSNSFTIDVTSVDDVFGWQQRWYDLKWYKDEAHGNFAKFVNTTGVIRSSQQTSWLFSRPLGASPILASSFVKTSPINYPFVSQDVDIDNYNVDMAFDITAYRKIEAVETF